MLRVWMDASRWAYNKTVEVLRGLERGTPTPHWQDTEFVNKVLAEMPERLIGAPYQVKKIAVRDALAALREGKARVVRGEIEQFELGWRSRKSPVQSMFIPASAMRPTGFYQRALGRMRAAEAFPASPRDSRLVHRGGRWYLAAPGEVAARVPETQGHVRVAAIDPGVRTFATVYGLGDDDGGVEVVAKFGGGAQTRIFRLALHADRMISALRTRPTRARKTSLKRALDRVKWKIRDLVSELHNQVARWLVDRFDMVLLPTFCTSEMVVRGERKIRSKSVRAMLSLSHYKFAQQLEGAARTAGRPVEVRRVSEAWTSRTNSWTGEIMPRFSRESFVSDGVRIDRDINGARGILLRALGDSPAAAPQQCAGDTIPGTEQV